MTNDTKLGEVILEAGDGKIIPAQACYSYLRSSDLLLEDVAEKDHV